MLMSLSRRLAFCGLALVAGCRLEDHTPEGSRRDEAQIREVIVEYYRAFARMDGAACRKFFARDGVVSRPSAVGDSTADVTITPADSFFLNITRISKGLGEVRGEVHVLRVDLKQVDGVASVWATVRMDFPPHVVEQVEHLVLHRTSEGWRIILLSFTPSG